MSFIGSKVTWPLCFWITSCKTCNNWSLDGAGNYLVNVSAIQDHFLPLQLKFLNPVFQITCWTYLCSVHGPSQLGNKWTNEVFVLPLRNTGFKCCEVCAGFDYLQNNFSYKYYCRSALNHELVGKVVYELSENRM